LLEVRNLSLAYGVNRVVRDISFAVEPGTLYALLGANGAGKTSTLRAISGLLGLDGGDILFAGESLRRDRPHKVVRRGISHVPEGRKIFAEMSVLDNLLVGATVLIRNRSRVAELLERNFALFPILRERAAQPGGALSGGQQQQLTIARGLMSDPKLLIVDEPTLGLAPTIINAVADTFRKLLGLGLTILVAEQNAEFALRIADRGIVLSSGKVSFLGDVKSLRAGDGIRRAYLGG
jgi:branched-chain amino acid transport system ATP-binding protein